MLPVNRVEMLIDHYKQHLDNGEIVFQEICENRELVKFQLPHDEIVLTAAEREEFIRRYVAEIAPLVRDLKRIR